MTILEAQLLKKETEVKIVELLDNFTKQTGLSVDGVTCFTDSSLQTRKVQFVIFKLDVKL